MVAKAKDGSFKKGTPKIPDIVAETETREGAASRRVVDGRLFAEKIRQGKDPISARGYFFG